MKFKVGDRVCIKRDASPPMGGDPDVRGVPTRIIGPSLAFDWTLDLVGFGGFPIGANERVLEHLIEPGSWDEITRMVGKDIRDPVPA